MVVLVVKIVARLIFIEFPMTTVQTGLGGKRWSSVVSHPIFGTTLVFTRWYQSVPVLVIPSSLFHRIFGFRKAVKTVLSRRAASL